MCDSKLTNITAIIASIFLTVFLYGHIASANSAYMSNSPQLTVEDKSTPKEAAVLAVALASRAVARGTHDESSVCRANAVGFAPKVASLSNELDKVEAFGNAPMYEAIQIKAEYILEKIEISSC